MATAPTYDYGAGAQGVGMLFGAAATVMGANASVAAARQQQAYLNKSADYDLLKGRLAMQDIDRQARGVLAAQKTSYAAQNVDLSSESVSQVREETFMEANRVKNEVELAAAMEAWGKREQGAIGVEAAKDAQRAARIGAAGQVIGGVGMLAAAGS
jgi:gas vesicle protein